MKKLIGILLLILIGITAATYWRDKPYKELASLLKVYEVSDDNKPIALKRFGKQNDGGYVVPLLAFEKAQALLGYGVFTDISFEEDFSKQYRKPSFGFDCGVTKFQKTERLFQFVPECISTSNFVAIKEPLTKISTFNEELQALKLENKQLFVKMDIEGAEFDAIPDILKHANNITGIVLEIHFNNDGKSIRKTVDLLSQINKDFVLVHLHGNNCNPYSFKTSKAKGNISTVLELSYINRNLIKTSKLASDQKVPKTFDMVNCVGSPDWEFEVI